VSEWPRVRLGGYSPRGSTHSDALDRIASTLRMKLACEVSVDYNVLERGGRVESLLDDVESGEVTACYFSTSYLAARVPVVGIVDIPFIFDSVEHAHRCLDGPLGCHLSERTAAATRLVPLGYWDNGMRHLSNRLHPVADSAGCRGLRIRLQPNWAHERYFAGLGAEPVPTGLRDGIAMLESGEVDAQENPLANFVAYGIERLHPYLTLTGHAFGARGVYASAAQLVAWPEDSLEILRDAAGAAIAAQRLDAAAKEEELRSALAASGTEILELEPDSLAAFREAASPVLGEARARIGDEPFGLIES
jgi:TRAP-type C4-dicarboxylate transport system substrate-binding protein